MKNKLSDKDFFELYCSSANIIFNNDEREVAFIKDQNFNYRYASTGYLESLYPQDTITLDYIKGRSFSAINNEFQGKILSDLAYQDQLVRSSLYAYSSVLMGVHNKVILIRKRPIINPSTNNFVGILGTARPFMLPHLLKFIHTVNGLTLDSESDARENTLDHALTPRQSLVLFLCINRYSYTEIAAIATSIGEKMSPEQVNSYLDNLKHLFGVRGKVQLIKKALSLKYHLCIPRQLVRAGSFLLDDEIVIVDEVEN